MIVHPEERVADFAKAGSDIISVHAEPAATVHLDRTVNQASIAQFCPQADFLVTHKQVQPWLLLEHQSLRVGASGFSVKLLN